MKVQEQCYAGREADERPVRVLLEEHEYRVEEVLGPEHLFFKVRADEGKVYILRRIKPVSPRKLPGSSQSQL